MSLKKRVTKKSTAPARTKAKAKAPAKAKARQYHIKVIKPESGKARKPDLESVDQIFESLAPKQQQFILEYLANGFNGTQAARTVGYAARNADTQASRLLANPKIAAVIAERKQKLTAKREITAERVLDEIAKAAYFDVRRFFRPDGTLVPIHELDECCAAALTGVEITEISVGRGKGKKAVGYLKKIKFADRGLNNERLGRYLKLFTDRVEHSADKDFVLTVKSILSGETK